MFLRFIVRRSAQLELIQAHLQELANQGKRHLGL